MKTKWHATKVPMGQRNQRRNKKYPKTNESGNTTFQNR